MANHSHPFSLLRLGYVAPELPPMIGGMAELARGLGEQLARHTRLHLFSFSAGELTNVPDRAIVERHAITGRVAHDAPLLESSDPSVDAWLVMNAGLIPLARHVAKPFFAYFHGNDFVNPFLACGPTWMERIRRPYAARVRHPLRRWQLRRALPHVRHVFTNSQQTRDLIHHRFDLETERTSVIYPGVGDRFFQERSRVPSRSLPTTEALRLLTVTRLSSHTRRKNVDGVMQAMALLRDRLDLTYTVVGDGDDRSRLESMAEQLGLGDRVHFAGKVSLDEILQAYAKADLFVMASKASAFDVEGFGIVYLEAAAAGLPSLCSREGGATDAVDDGRNGVLIDRSTPESIAAGIERFVAERQRFTPERVRAFAEGFRWPIIAEQLLSSLKRQLAG